MESLGQKPVSKSKGLEKILTQPADQLQFLPHDYLLELATEVLHIPKDERDYKPKKILKLALQDVQFFKKMIADQSDSLFEQCLDRIEHIKMQKDQIVCSIGERGNAFYVVMSGEVSVNVHVQKQEDKGTHKKSKSKQSYLELQEVSVLKAGSYFGELALLNDEPRTATIICKETCNFAVLFRDDFKEVLSKHAMWQIQQDIQFFSSLPIFTTSSQRAISTLIYHFKLLKLSRNNVLFKEGDQATHLYIIKKGEVKITKKVDITVPEDPYKAHDEYASKKIGQRILELVVLGQKEIFGEEELYYEKIRETSAIVSSTEAEIFTIDKADFERRLKETDEFTDYFNKYCKEKLEQRNTRLQFIKDTVSQSQEIAHAVKSRPSSPDKKRLEFVSPERRPETPSPIKRPATSSSRKRSQTQKVRSSFSPRREVSYAAQVMSGKIKGNTIEPSHLLQSIDKTLNHHPDSIQSSVLHVGVPAMNTTHQSFFRNVHSSQKKSSEYGNRSTMTPSTRPHTRHASMPLAVQTANSWNIPVKRPVTGSINLFEQNIFEENKPKILARAGDKSKTAINRRRSNDSSGHHHSHLLNRTYFSTKKREYMTEKDMRASLLENQKKILKDKLQGHPIEESVTIDFLDDFQKRRKPKSPPNHHREIKLVDRIKNLPIFQTGLLTKTEQSEEIKNIHVHSKRMQAFMSDVFRNQVKILRHIGFNLPQRPTSSYKASPQKTQGPAQNTVLLYEQVFKNIESNPRSPRSGRSPKSSVINSVDLEQTTNRSLMRPRYHSRENSISESSNRGMVVRGLKGRSLHDSL